LLYVYAIVDSPVAPDIRGFDDEPVRTVFGANVGAIVSEHEEVRLDLEADDLWMHERVVEEAMEIGTVLPMRLGSAVADDAALLAMLLERDIEFESTLRRVRGAVEVGVRAIVPEPRAEVDAPTGAEPGTAYLLGRLAQKQAADEIVAGIHVPLSELARDHRPLSSPDTGPPLRGAYLVDRELLEAFRSRVASLDREMDGVKLACTGPWPPYSFTGAPPS
jgi:hypothetical protein